MFNYDKLKLSKIMIIWGIIFTIIFLTGLIVMGLGTQFEGQPSEHLVQILKNPYPYQIGFLFAGMTGPVTSIVMIILILFVKTKNDTPLLDIFSLFFLASYLVLESVAYISQSTYFISLLQTNIEAAKEWYFGNFHSFCYFIQQLGYLFFALSGILLGYRYCLDNGIKRIFGIFLEIRCLCTIIAFTGLVMDNQYINKATLISLGLTCFLGIFTILISISINKTNNN